MFSLFWFSVSPVFSFWFIERFWNPKTLKNENKKLPHKIWKVCFVLPVWARMPSRTKTLMYHMVPLILGATHHVIFALVQHCKLCLTNKTNPLFCHRLPSLGIESSLFSYHHFEWISRLKGRGEMGRTTLYAGKWMEISRFTTAFSAVKIFLDKQKKGIFTDKKKHFWHEREKKNFYDHTCF